MMETADALESASFVDTWQSYAFQASDYSKGERYSALLALLVETDRYSYILYWLPYFTYWGTFIILFCFSDEASLDLRGNQPLLSKCRLQDKVTVVHLLILIKFLILCFVCSVSIFRILHC